MPRPETGVPFALAPPLADYKVESGGRKVLLAVRCWWLSLCLCRESTRGSTRRWPWRFRGRLTRGWRRFWKRPRSKNVEGESDDAETFHARHFSKSSSSSLPPPPHQHQHAATRLRAPRPCAPGRSLPRTPGAPALRLARPRPGRRRRERRSPLRRCRSTSTARTRPSPRRRARTGLRRRCG